MEDFLMNRVYVGTKIAVTLPDPADVEGFNVFLNRFKVGLMAEKAAEKI